MDASFWSASVDGYCERTDASLWSEPLNAASNVAFLVAALAAAWLLARRGGRDPAAAVLVAIVAAIGFGSFLFHTVATRWAALADVAPIAVFIHLYLFVALRRFLRLRLWSAGAGVVAFAALSRLGEPPFRTALASAGASDAVLSSTGYMPAALALFVIGGLASGRDSAQAGRGLLLIGVCFAASLAVRSADLALCAFIPAGTHWLWHVLNAVVLYGLVRIAILERAARPAAPALPA